MATPPSEANEQNVNQSESDRAGTMFPVTSSLLSAKALLHKVMTDYSLSQPVACQLLRRGLSDTYLIRTPHDSYILRIYRPNWRSVSEILYEMEMLSYLRQHGAPVSAPLRRKDGDFIHGLHALEGLRYMALFTYAKGEEPSLSEEQGYQMGEATAAIHQASEGFSSHYARFSLDVDHLIHLPLRLAEPYLQHRPEDVSFLLRLANALSERILSLAPRLDWGICHGDGTERNAHITKDGVVTFFDFDCGGLGWRAYDWATFRMNARKRPKGDAIWAAYVKGYTSRRPINPIDMEAEPFLFVARIFWSMGIFPATAEDDLAEPLNDHFIDRQLVFLRPWAIKQLHMS